jgi:hypothetical protein
MHPFTIQHLTSGAMLAGIVDQAISVALQRDKVTGKASGVCAEDITVAVRKMVHANRGLNHDDDLAAFAEAHGAPIEAIQRVAA